MKSAWKYLFCVWSIPFLLSTSAAAVPVSLVLQWEHQAQFSGYYMALEKGFFAAENLEVTLLPGGADVDPILWVQEGQSEFCTAMLSSALQTDADLKLMAQVLNRSNFAMVAWREGADGTGAILEPIDLSGKKVTLWERFEAPYSCFLKKQAIEVERLPQYYTVSLFLNRGADACTAMLYNEYNRIQQKGVEPKDLTVFPLYEYGVVLPEDGIYCRADYAAAHPERCAAFARACMKGWAYARDHEAETLDVVMRYIETDKVPTNRAHMKWMLEVILASIYPENPGDWVPGTLARDRYAKAVEMLGEQNPPQYDFFVAEGARDGKN